MRPLRWVKAANAPQPGRGSACQLVGFCSIYDLLTLRPSPSPSPAFNSWHICPLQPHHTRTHTRAHTHTHTPLLSTWLDCWKPPSFTRWGVPCSSRLLTKRQSIELLVGPLNGRKVCWPPPLPPAWPLSEQTLGWLLHYTFNYSRGAFERVFTTPFFLTEAP